VPCKTWIWTIINRTQPKTDSHYHSLEESRQQAEASRPAHNLNLKWATTRLMMVPVIGHTFWTRESTACRARSQELNKTFKLRRISRLKNMRGRSLLLRTSLMRSSTRRRSNSTSCSMISCSRLTITWIEIDLRNKKWSGSKSRPSKTDSGRSKRDLNLQSNIVRRSGRRSPSS